MNAHVDDHRVVVVLSRRNLLALLDKVDDPNSAATIHRLCDNDIHVVVMAQSDDEHYAGRTPGPMSGRSEAFIEEHLHRDDHRI